MLIAVVLLLVLSALVFAKLEYEDGAPTEYDSTFYDSDGNDDSFDEIFFDDAGTSFTYALGVWGNDDDTSCDVDDVINFNVLKTKKIGVKLGVAFPFFSYNNPLGNTFNRIPAVGEEINDRYQCVWDDLPLTNTAGCYFLSEEEDGKSNDAPTPNDCAGFFIPEGTVIRNDPTVAGITGKSLFGEEVPPENTFGRVFGSNKLQSMLVSGEAEKNYIDNEHSICAFNNHLFQAPVDQTFVCLKREDEFRWYVCDADSLGKSFIVESADAEQESVQPWVCSQDDTGYIWEQRELTCEDVDNCEQDRAACIGSGNDWLEDAENGNNCCGNNPGDLLDITTARGSPLQQVCLDTDLVEETLPGESEPSSEDPQTTATGHWQWIDAGNTDLQIISVDNRDVVSDSVNWHICSAEAEGTLGISSEISPRVTDVEKATSFYCYQQGQRWSWAECRADTETVSQEGSSLPNKVRKAGDGLYALSPITGSHDVLNIIPESEYFDFSGYNQMDIFFGYVSDEQPSEQPPAEGEAAAAPAEKYITPEAPAVLTLEIIGFNNQVIYSRSILSDVKNQLFSPTSAMHAVVPIPENLRNVEAVKLTSSPSENKISVSNVYLNNKENPTVLCSGKLDAQKGAWITDYDVPQGKDLCIAHFGETAWFEETSQDSALCCGNADNEYYAGSSVNGQGCWNSQVVQAGQTVADVEFEVTYQERPATIDIEYPESDKIGYTLTYFLERTKQTNRSQYDLTIDNSVYGREGQFMGSHRFALDPDREHKLWLGDIRPKGGSTEEFSNVFLEQGFDFYFYNPRTGGEFFVDRGQPPTVTKTQRELGLKENYDPIEVRLRVRPEAIRVSMPEASRLPGTFSYTCAETECLFPLPGEGPYVISNPHPELYELWFVNEAGRQPISAGPFEGPGNVLATAVSQQVLLADTENERGFRGCKAPAFVGAGAGTWFSNTNSCSVYGSLFCSPSVRQDGKTIVNSWVSEALTKIGSVAPEGDIPEDLTELYLGVRDLNVNEIDLERDNLTSIFPGRNLLSNALFNRPGGDMPYWELISNGQVLSDVRQNFADNLLHLNEGDTLRSERIAVDNFDLHFSAEGSCRPIFVLLGGMQSREVQELEFNTGDASVLQLTFNGPCDISKPYLQIVEAGFPSAENFRERDYEDQLENNDARQPLACCPTNYCWNGFACSEPMSEATNIGEVVDEGRIYRCVQGDWKALPVRWNWDHDEWGFCSAKEQCLVSGDGTAEGTAQTIYTGDVPNCVDDNEYVFDHLCENGEWSSRTKFLAGSLLEIAGDRDYRLLCGNYRDVLNELDNSEQFIGGGISAAPTVDQSEPLQEGLQNIQTCFGGEQFSGDDPLVPPEDNTCINNVCLLQYKDGNDFKTLMATSLNIDINDPNSFTQALNIPPEQVNCQEGGDFVQCDIGNRDEFLWYSKDLNSIIYAKENFERGFFGRVADVIGGFFSSLFGAENVLDTEDNSNFISESQNLRDVYVLKDQDLGVRAVREIQGEKQTLIAEYENFDTPVCEYLKPGRLVTPTGLSQNIAQEGGFVSPDTFACTEDENLQRIEATSGTNFLWPQLTARLRPSIE